jgi:cytoskeletal protein CcmA (bactofilin family)
MSAATARSANAERRTSAQLADAPTVIDAGASFEGLLTFRGAARVDGHLVGRVVADGCLVIGPRGRVEAEVEVDELVVGGEFEGEARAHRRVELLSSARARGTLHAPRFSLAEGCLFDGVWRTGAPEAEPAGEAAAEDAGETDAPGEGAS